LEISFKSKAHGRTLAICGMLLFAAIFLPWMSVGGAAAGFGTSDWGAMSTIAAILGLGLAFLTNTKLRAVGLITVGVLALVGAIIYAVRIKGGATVDFGIIFEMLFALAAIVFGFQDYTKRGSK
jgi:hypothetical protein